MADNANTTAPTASPIVLPLCGCGNDFVSRFVIVDGENLLACTRCFKNLSNTGEVTHHIRSSHADCAHDNTPKSRAACRKARRSGTVYVEDGFGDEEDEDDVTHVGSTKGSKRVHAVNEATGATACGKTPKTLVVTEGSADDVDCPECMDAI